MAEKVVPMIHVPDVRATVDWYQGIQPSSSPYAAITVKAEAEDTQS